MAAVPDYLSEIAVALFDEYLSEGNPSSLTPLPVELHLILQGRQQSCIQDISMVLTENKHFTGSVQK